MFGLTLPGKMTIWISFLSLLSFKIGFSMGGTCRPVCAESWCITVNQARVDFKTAEETCRDRAGELMTFQHEMDKAILDILTQELNGNFWIGLRLPGGACSNLSAPLRGYEWTSGSTHGSLYPSTNWKGSVEVCSPHCVSLSNEQKLTENLCSDKTDGFLCRTKHKDSCKAQGLSDSIFFQSAKGCSSGPCEHKCTEVKEGYKCSCFQGYMPDSKDPRTCKLYCEQNKCPALCDNNECLCPDGFILNENVCEDIDECSMKECDQECKNTFGSFECSCRKGFVLAKKFKCKLDSFTTVSPVTDSSIESPVSNNSQNFSRAPAAGFLWIWVFVAVIIVALIVTVRFYVVRRQRRREQNSNTQSTTTAP